MDALAKVAHEIPIIEDTACCAGGSYYGRPAGTLGRADFPVSRDCDRQTMALPLHNQMVPEDYEYVVQVLKELC